MMPADPWDAAIAGFTRFRTRLVKDGPWVSASLRIQSVRGADGKLVQDQKLLATVRGETRDVSNGAVPGWPWFPISEWEHSKLSADEAWCDRYAPHKPAANPQRRRSVMDAPVPF